jgi:hypothetical protein
VCSVQCITTIVKGVRNGFPAAAGVSGSRNGHTQLRQVHLPWICATPAAPTYADGLRLVRLALGLPALEGPTPRRRASPARGVRPRAPHASVEVEEPREHGGEAVGPEAVARGREVQEVVPVRV